VEALLLYEVHAQLMRGSIYAVERRFEFLELHTRIDARNT
jgi:hypothetical protein